MFICDIFLYTIVNNFRLFKDFVYNEFFVFYLLFNNDGIKVEICMYVFFVSHF